ncbi:MAG: hypothetical protein R2795_24010 [Saprospiraceae bacterium]
MGNRRYPGPKPFAAGQSALFNGRQQETRQLLRLIDDHQLTVLYGRSGYGKSSLLNAAVLPEMVEKGYHLINVRMGAWTPDSTNTPLRSTVQAIAENPKNLEKTILDDLVAWDNSLWYYAKTFAINTEKTKLLFVFDQFEELFTYPAKDTELYENALAELLKTNLPQRYRDQLKSRNDLEGHVQRPAVFERLDIKVVIAIRSNRFHLLERMTPTLPQILQHTMELDALNREGARTAIVAPAAEAGGQYDSQPFGYSPEVQEAMLDFLSQEGKVEGVLLQMLCQYFERLVIDNPKKKRIELSDLHAHTGGSVPDDSALEAIVDAYYQSRINDLPDDQEGPVKRFIEDNLVQRVGDGGMRLSMHQAQISERFGIEAEVLDTLVDNGLLRTEPYLRGGVTYELTHDRLIAPVLKSKAAYDATEADRLKEQLEEEERKRKEAEALRHKAEEAQQVAENAKKTAEDNEKRAKWLAKIAVAAFAVAVLLGIYAWATLQTVRSERADKNLILCKEFVVDARRLAKADYCTSAAEKIGKALLLIEVYGHQGKDVTCAAYEREETHVRDIQQLLTNKQKQGACR